MKWSYGVTTCESRVKEGKLLTDTLRSLVLAGFPKPRLFIDGGEVPNWAKEYEVTHHSPNLRTFGNWVTAAWELYIREPSADRYAIFQDDFVTYRNLRGYLERCEYPPKGYFNCYTFPENERNERGWYKSNQGGRGAVALVFNSEALRTLLTQSHLVNRPLDPKRGWRSVDGGIVESFKKAGWKEYVHNPSLVQHAGKHSSMGNRRHPLANTFMGEDFDALRLLNPIVEYPNVSSGKRIGLVGYNCRTGLGELNRQIATYCEVDAWLVKPHRDLPTLEPHPDVETIVCPNGSDWRIEKFLSMIDTVVFAEQPYFEKLIDLCIQHKKRIVCVPMMEWMTPGARGWPQSCELLCPTQQSYDLFNHVAKCKLLSWPVDTERFKFVERAACKHFLYVEGHGGWHGRKGAAVVQEALKLWPEMPLLVRSQKHTGWSGVNFLAETKHNYELYGVGDVLICPHSVDGLGLEPMEAMSCGMPVITTDGKPWNEIPALARIPCKIEDRKVRRPVKWHLPDAKALVEICKGLLGSDLREASRDARDWAESRSWTLKAAEVNARIRGESC